MITKKKLLPGQPGTKKLQKKYGDKLICVRYKYDLKNKKMLKSVELIEEKSEVKSRDQIPPNKIIKLKIGFEEKYFQKLVRQAGGRWNRKDQVWELMYKNVNELGLKNRIVK